MPELLTLSDVYKPLQAGDVLAAQGMIMNNRLAQMRLEQEQKKIGVDETVQSVLSQAYQLPQQTPLQGPTQPMSNLTMNDPNIQQPNQFQTTPGGIDYGKAEAELGRRGLPQQAEALKQQQQQKMKDDFDFAAGILSKIKNPQLLKQFLPELKKVSPTFAQMNLDKVTVSEGTVTYELPGGGQLVAIPKPDGSGYEYQKVEPKTGKAPLPTTDKGWTIEFDPAKGINIASKQKPDGTIQKEPYNPDQHGAAVSTSETPIQRELEKGILTDGEAKEYGAGIAAGRIAPRQINEIAGGFGQVANINRGKIAKVMAKEYPKFGWKNADILFKYQESPQVFMGIVSINAVRPRVEALRGKFASIKNLDVLPANAAKNAIAKQFGDAAIVDFESTRTQVVFELQRALTGIGMMSDSRVQQELNNLNSSYAPRQMNKAIDNINDILDARLSALQAGPFSGAGPQAFPQTTPPVETTKPDALGLRKEDPLGLR